MTRDEAIAMIREHIGFNSRLNSASIIMALKVVQDTLELSAELPWFLRTEMSSITCVIGEERIPLPVDFLQEVEDEHLYIYDNTISPPWKQLCKVRMDEVRSLYSTTGRPIYYSLDGEYFRVAPAPDAVYTFKHLYFGKDEVLTTNIENKWLKHAPLLIIGSAGILVASKLRDARAKADFIEMANLGLSKLTERMQAREEANFRHVMGGED